MNCDCSYDDYDGPDFVSEKMVTARKDHQCCECHGKIGKGTEYEYVSGLWNGEFSTFKTCEPCQIIRSEYCPRGFCYGGLAETIWECLGVEL